MFFSIAFLLSHAGCPDFGYIKASYVDGKFMNSGYLETKNDKSEEEDNQEETILVSSIGKNRDKSSRKNPAAVGKFSFVADKKEIEDDEQKEEDKDETDDDLAKERLQLLAFSIAEGIAPLQQVSSLADFVN